MSPPDSEAIVRRARPDDWPQVSGLYDVLDALHRAGAPWMFDTPAAQPRSEDFFSDLLTSDDAAVFVADAGHVVGFGHGLVRAAPDFPGFVKQPWGVLDGLVVDPAWRRRGIGKLITQAIEEWAIGLGAPWVELNVYAFNGEAREFYEALGYLPMSTKLRKPSPGAA